MVNNINHDPPGRQHEHVVEDAVIAAAGSRLREAGFDVVAVERCPLEECLACPGFGAAPAAAAA